MPGNHLVLLPDAPTFTIVAVSDDYLASVGVHRDSLLGNGLLDVFFKDGRNETTVQQLLQSLTQVIQTKQLHAMADLWQEWPNAQTGAMESRSWRSVNKPVIGSDNEVAYIFHTIEDITHAVQLMEIAEANRYLQTIINGFKEPLQILQPVVEDGKIIDFRFKLTNQAYAAYTNTTPEQLQGKRVGEVFPGYFETISFTNPVETYTTGQPLTFEIHYDKDGLDLYNLMSTSKLDDEVVIHFTDFTRLRHLQLQLESKIEELKRSNQQLEDFAHAASHDLKEPVRKIQAFSELLKTSLGGQLSDTATVYFDRIQTAAMRMNTLIEALLAYSALDQQSATREEVPLHDVVAQVLIDLEYEIEQKGATVLVGELCVVKGYRRQWEQAFQNLLSNALKYSKPTTPPCIHINCTTVSGHDVTIPIAQTDRSTDFHLVRIQDNGIGFNRSDAARIFDVFTRLHGASKYKGSGVGLSTVKKVVRNHGGYIWADSEPGEGSTFFILLPKSE
ncbi:sensor histidine kinase [Spirosoma fluminis]